MPGDQKEGAGVEGEECEREQAIDAPRTMPESKRLGSKRPEFKRPESKRPESKKEGKDLTFDEAETEAATPTSKGPLPASGPQATLQTEAAMRPSQGPHRETAMCAEGQMPTAQPISSGKKAARQAPAKGKLPIYGALDLGTNNCRLLLARPNRRGFEIVDAFSRIIRLGEGVSETGHLSDQAMERTTEALEVCAEKIDQFHVSRMRLIATEACRAAENSQQFIDIVQRKTGLDLEIIGQETEAKLAVIGCVTLINESCDYALIFDIGGGSSELIWLDISKIRSKAGNNYIGAEDAIVDWISIPVGVVTLAEKFSGTNVSQQNYQDMVAHTQNLLQDFAQNIAEKIDHKSAKIHYLGTSGTVTTIAGVYLGLNVYDRSRIDGLWMQTTEARNISNYLLNLSFEQRASLPCIGRERADLVLGGCAILEAMLETWPTDQLRVADRGLREGILAQLMAEDGYIKPGQCWASMPKQSKSRHKGKSKSSKKGSKRRRPTR